MHGIGGTGRPAGRSIRRGTWVGEGIDASAIQHAAETQWSDEWAHTCLATTFALLGCPWLNPLWELSSSIGLRVRLCSAANMFQSKRRIESYGHGEWVKQVASVVVSLSSQFLFKSSGNHLNSFFEGLEIILTRAKANSILEYFTAHYSLEKGHSSPVDSPWSNCWPVNSTRPK